MDNDQDTNDLTPRKGTMVVGSDGMRVGEIDLVDTNYFIVRAGGFFPQDHFIPISDIVARDADGALRLSMPADEALERTMGDPNAGLQGDVQVPEGDLSPDETLDADTRASTADDVEAGVATRDEVAEARNDEETTTVAETDVTEPRHDEDMHRTVELYEEELSASTRPVERGVVRVEKKIVEERQTLEVPVVEEEVEVTRRRVDREVTEEDHPFEERTIEIPLHGEAVEIQKHAKVVEEIDIDKTARERIEEVSATARKETAEVEGENVETETVDTDTDLADSAPNEDTTEER